VSGGVNALVKDNLAIMAGKSDGFERFHGGFLLGA
jgi:hypothetical protein